MEDRHLVIQGNAFYELDEECLEKKQTGESCRHKEKEEKKTDKKQKRRK